MLAKLWQIAQELLAEVAGIKRKLRNITVGPGMVMKNEPGGLYIGLAPKREYNPAPFVSGGGTFLVRITAHSGSFPAWTYTGYRVTGYDSTETGYERYTIDEDDDSLTIYNRAEFAPQGGTYPYEYGNGSNITDSSGTIDEGSCVIIPIGIGSVVEVRAGVDEDGDPHYSFVAMNSSEAVE